MQDEYSYIFSHQIMVGVIVLKGFFITVSMLNVALFYLRLFVFVSLFFFSHAYFATERWDIE
jgi:hypothetical protein